jgi:hypothetical protein
MQLLRNNKGSYKQHPDNGYQTPNNRWIDKQEVLEHMRIGDRTLQKWRSDGILPFYRICGRIYYREGDLEMLLEKHKCIGTKRYRKRKK